MTLRIYICAAGHIFAASEGVQVTKCDWGYESQSLLFGLGKESYTCPQTEIYELKSELVNV